MLQYTLWVSDWRHRYQGSDSLIGGSATAFWVGSRGVRFVTYSVGDLRVEPDWADSMGAKTSCVRVETTDTSICIDPGVAAMQPSYPLPDELKFHVRTVAEDAIREAIEDSDHVSISHSHYDHYIPDPALFTDAELWVKDPNQWINDSQWDRARDFLGVLADEHGESLESMPPARRAMDYPDPYDELDHARGKDFGDYQERREELLEKWRERFEGGVEHWANSQWVVEPDFCTFADGEAFSVGDTTVEFIGPLFHGIEYARTGWVFATRVETAGASFLHTSDLQGPVIEDYADRIIDLDPDVIFIDGPATYLLGPMLNQTNLQRSIDNAARIIEAVDPALAFFDHHLLRERKYRERTSDVWDLRDEGYSVTTMAEHRGEDPLIDQRQTWDEAELERRAIEAASAFQRDQSRVATSSSNASSAMTTESVRLRNPWQSDG